MSKVVYVNFRPRALEREEKSGALLWTLCGAAAAAVHFVGLWLAGLPLW